MNKKIYLLILIAFIGVTCGMYAVYSYTAVKNKTEGSVKNTKPTIQVKKENNAQSIVDLISSDKALECSFTSNIEGVKTTGTTYVANNKIKGEFTTTVKDKAIKNYILSDGTYFYSWNEDSLQGYKIKTDTVKSDLKSQQLESFKKFSDKYEYKCKPWANSDNAFDAPDNVIFNDFSNVLTTPNGNINMCSGCEFIKDEADKKQCKLQFNCK